MNTNILIAGGSGLVGSQLTKILQQRGFQASHLTRNPKKSAVPAFYWNPDKGEIDLNCLNNTNCIINLAGAGVADARWTNSYKEKILNSRLYSTQLLSKILRENQHQVKTIVNASAVGIYGNNVSTPADEDTPAASTFLADVCKQWEHEALQMSNDFTRVVVLRIGLVLSEKGGFLKA
ncbi:MAG: NAD-dependent epimerase/dehydratase family protein, partial [Bacteroidia bacterium]